MNERKDRSRVPINQLAQKAYEFSKLRTLDNPDLGIIAQEMNVPRSIRDSAIEDLGLPHTNHLIIPIEQIPPDPQELFETVGSQRFRFSFEPTEKGLERNLNRKRKDFRPEGYSVEEILAAREELISPEETEFYNLSLYQNVKNVYAGNMIITPQGKILVEMIRGDHAEIVHGERTPDIRYIYTPSTKTENLTSQQQPKERYLIAVYENDPDGTKTIVGYEETQDERIIKLVNKVLNPVRALPDYRPILKTKILKDLWHKEDTPSYADISEEEYQRYIKALERYESLIQERGEENVPKYEKPIPPYNPPYRRNANERVVFQQIPDNEGEHMQRPGYWEFTTTYIDNRETPQEAKADDIDALTPIYIEYQEYQDNGMFNI